VGIGWWNNNIKNAFRKDINTIKNSLVQTVKDIYNYLLTTKLKHLYLKRKSSPKDSSKKQHY
jgi:hypothetical protein